MTPEDLLNNLRRVTTVRDLAQAKAHELTEQRDNAIQARDAYLSALANLVLLLDRWDRDAVVKPRGSRIITLESAAAQAREAIRPALAEMECAAAAAPETPAALPGTPVEQAIAQAARKVKEYFEEGGAEGAESMIALAFLMFANHLEGK